MLVSRLFSVMELQMSISLTPLFPIHTRGVPANPCISHTYRKGGVGGMQILKKFGGNTEMSNKLQVPEADRCRFTSAHGKRCRNPLRGGAGGLCIIHQQQFENLNNADARAISDQLLGAEPELRTHGKSQPSHVATLHPRRPEAHLAPGWLAARLHRQPAPPNHHSIRQTARTSDTHRLG